MNGIPPAALTGRRLLALDIEGNGAAPAEVVELSVIPVERGASLACARTWRVRPSRPITARATRIHGINSDVTACLPWNELSAEIEEELSDRPVVAHNAATDFHVLHRQLPCWRPSAVLDTLRLAKHVWPGLATYSLNGLLNHAHINLDEAGGSRRHQADYDAWCALRLLCRLVEDANLDWPRLVSAASLPAAAAIHQESLW